MNFVILEKEQIVLNTEPFKQKEIPTKVLKLLAGNPYRLQNYLSGKAKLVEPTSLFQMYCAALGVSLDELMDLPIRTIFQDTKSQEKSQP